ncbi:hypothetical protein ITQ94_06450 [Pediococcus pentosaceus]|uniref:hypothetical protein n=1 Tax=Pediococcus pentosaceus TaxID=1255 RepID=UPI0018FE1741|nr:hypothetical protein [Pediococcus pentosaceus]MBF7131107.1 hypothetical protein [Pediococcus pentosaceus]
MTKDEYVKTLEKHMAKVADSKYDDYYAGCFDGLKKAIDVVKVANLAGQGLTFAEISRKMHRSKDYINKVARDFDIKIFTKKER